MLHSMTLLLTKCIYGFHINTRIKHAHKLIVFFEVRNNFFLDEHRFQTVKLAVSLNLQTFHTLCVFFEVNYLTFTEE